MPELRTSVRMHVYQFRNRRIMLFVQLLGNALRVRIAIYCQEYERIHAGLAHADFALSLKVERFLEIQRFGLDRMSKGALMFLLGYACQPCIFFR